MQILGARRDIRSLSLPLDPAPYDWIDDVKIVWREYGGAPAARLDFRFNILPEHWAKPWSIAQYAEVLQRVVAERSLPGLEYSQEDEIVLNDLALRGVFEPSQLISREVERCSAFVRAVCGDAEAIVAAEARPETLVALFAFPSEIRTACEQYLVYFVQFLEDLGIHARSELQEQAQGVLFTIVPAEGAEALERIRRALDLYLHLPQAPNFAGEAAGHHDVAAQQLVSNVLHLQSQLARAVLQAKDSTIEALQLSNLNYRRLLTGDRALLDQQADDTNADEELLGGAVTITKYKGKGFELNLPMLLKKLKRSFRRK